MRSVEFLKEVTLLLQGYSAPCRFALLLQVERFLILSLRHQGTKRFGSLRRLRSRSGGLAPCSRQLSWSSSSGKSAKFWSTRLEKPSHSLVAEGRATTRRTAPDSLEFSRFSASRTLHERVHHVCERPSETLSVLQDATSQGENSRSENAWSELAMESRGTIHASRYRLSCRQRKAL